MDIYDIKITASSGEKISINEYKNMVLVVVNTANKCKFAEQFE